MFRHILFALLPLFGVCYNSLVPVNNIVIAGSTAPCNDFDPLALASTPERGVFFREAELKHSRIAMVSSVSIPIIEQFTHKPGIYAFSELPHNVQLGVVGITFISEFGSMLKGWENPVEKPFTLVKDYQPGDLGFRLSEDIEIDMYNKELNNGRLAMIGSIGMIAQELATQHTLF